MAWWNIFERRPAATPIHCPCGSKLFYELPVRELFQMPGWVEWAIALDDMKSSRAIAGTVKEFECVQCGKRWKRSELGSITPQE